MSQEYPREYHRIYQVEGEGKSLEKVKAAGVAVATPSKEDMDKVREAARAAILDKWAGDAIAKGLPAGLVYDTYVSLIRKYEPP